MDRAKPLHFLIALYSERTISKGVRAQIPPAHPTEGSSPTAQPAALLRARDPPGLGIAGNARAEPGGSQHCHRNSTKGLLWDQRIRGERELPPARAPRG